MSKSPLPKSTRWLLPVLATLIPGAALYHVRSGPPAREAPAAHQQPPPSTSPAQPVPASADNHREARATSPPQAVALTQVAPPDPSPPDPSSPATATAPVPATITATAGDLPADFLDRIVSGDAVAFTLPDGSVAAGGIGMSQRDAHGLRFVQGRLSQPAPGFYFFQRQTVAGVAGPLVGHVRFDGKQEAWKIEPTGVLGVPRMLARTLDDILCVNYAQPGAAAVAQAAAGGVANAPQTHPTNLPLPSYQSVISLQSLPGAAAVIYLDFDGESGPFPGWGDFNAAPSGANNSQVFEVWQMVCEDYQGFNINVTTDRMVFDNAPQGRRQHCIITPTTAAAPGAGGVSYVGSFNWGEDRVNWSFSTTGKSAGEVISHEVGHALNLSHDGRTSPSEEYYGGHGSGATGWAPIMGVGYYQNLSQWSKGEYLNSNQTQDDLSIIVNNNNEVDYRADDTGEVLATARYLEIASNNTVANEGIIETTGDVDAFRFATAGGLATLNVNTVSLNPNLDIQAELVNAATHAVVASNNPDAAINAVVAATLAAGEYLLRVRGVGRGNVLGDGYTNYGSLGSYLISGSVVGGVKAERFAIAENSANGTLVGSVVARNNHAGAPLAYAIASGNSNGALSINPATGALSVATSALLDFEALSLRWDDPATLELFVAISDAAHPALNETLRTVVTVLDGYDAPVFTSNPIQLFAARDRSFSAALSATNGDMGGTLTYAKVSGPVWLSVAANGTLSGTPSSANAGANIFVVRATDAAGLFGQATLNIMVAEAATWLNPAGGSWADAANWLGGAIGSGAAITADFSSLDLGADATVTLDGARTLGNLWFGDSAPSHNWTLTAGSAGPLTLDNGASQPLIAVNNSTTTIAAVLAGSNGLAKGGPGTLVLGGLNTYSGVTSVTAGTLVLRQQRNGGTITTAGGAITEWQQTADMGGNYTIQSAITFAGPGRVNKTGNFLLYAGIPAGYIKVSQSAGAVFDLQAGIIQQGGGSPGFITTNLGSLNVASGALFSLYASDATVDALTGSGTVETSNWSSTLTVGAANHTSSVDNPYFTGTSATFSGVLSNGSGTVALTKTGSGKQTLSGTVSYTGATTITQGTLELVKAIAFASTIVMGAANSPTLQLSSPLVTDTWTLAQPISGGSANARIEKSGPGTLVLTPSAGSSFTGSSSGALTVSGGTLNLSAAFTTAPAVSVASGARFGGSATVGNVTLADGATLEGGLGGSGTLTAANLTIGSRAADTATLKGTLSGSAGYKPLAVTNLTLNGGNNSVTLEAEGTGLTNGSAYDVLVSTNAISAPNASGGLAVNIFRSNSRAYTPNVDGTGKKVQLYYNADASVYWSGAASSAWNTSASNWKLGGNNVATGFFTNDVVAFHDNPVRATVDISNGDVSPLATTFDNSSATAYTLQGSNGIATGSLTKSGSGALTITNANSYGGGTTLDAGTLTIPNPAALGSGPVAIHGGTLQLDFSARAGEIASLGSFAIGSAGTLEIHSGTTPGPDTTYFASGVTFTGAGTITKTGTGYLGVGPSDVGLRDFAGLIDIQQGTLGNHGTGWGSGAGAMDLTIAAGAMLDMRSQNVRIDALSGAGTIGKSWVPDLNLSLGNNHGSATFSGVISQTIGGGSGSISLTKVGTGTQVLTGANAYTGATTITQGALQVDGSLAAGSNVAVGTAGTLSGSGSVNGNATLTGGGVINKSAGSIAGTLGVTGGNWNGNGSVTGAVTSSSGTLSIGAGANLTANGGLNVTGGSLVAGSSASTVSGSVNYTSATASTFGGIIAGSGKTLTLNNAATTLTLTGVNSYTGNTGVTAGTLVLRQQRTGGTITTASGAITEWQQTAVMSGDYALQGVITFVGAGRVNKTGAFYMYGGHVGGNLYVNQSAGAVFDLQAGRLDQGGGGPGFTTSNRGSLNVATGATLGLYASNAMVDALTGSGTIVNGYPNVTQTLTLGAANHTSSVDNPFFTGTSASFSGVLANEAGTLALAKTGSGTQVLTGANSYSGGTTVAQGTLAVSNTTGSGTGSGAVTVQATATLAGTGSISGSVSVAPGGFIAPGSAGTGTLSVAAAALSGTYQCQLGVATSDRLVISGALTVNPGAAIAVSSLGSPAAASYTIASYGSLAGTLPVVSGIPAGYVLDAATAGQLKLVRSGGGYSGWAGSFPGLSDISPGGDADHDGISNLLEYVIGGDPRVSGTSYLPGEAIVGSNLVLSYQRSDASEADTSQTGQWSSNMGTWHDIAPVLVNENAAAADSMEIRIPLTNAVGGKLFGRLHVTKP
jgi:autotransporter-associated beta strand protein